MASVLALVFAEDGVELRQFAGGQCRNGRLVSELLEAVDQLGVADHVEGMGVGGHGSGHVRVPVSDGAPAP